jgi:hypothetical protein
MSRVQIERLMDEVIKELLAEYQAEEEKKKEKVKKPTLLTFDMAINYLLSEYRKGNLNARIRRTSMPKEDYIYVLEGYAPFLPSLTYKNQDGVQPYTPGHSAIFATDWQISN